MKTRTSIERAMFLFIEGSEGGDSVGQQEKKQLSTGQLTKGNTFKTHKTLQNSEEIRTLHVTDFVTEVIARCEK